MRWLCCGGNRVGRVCEGEKYGYRVSGNGVYWNLYGGNRVGRSLKERGKMGVVEEREYGWEGGVKVSVREGGKG